MFVGVRPGMGVIDTEIALDGLPGRQNLVCISDLPLCLQRTEEQSDTGGVDVCVRPPPSSLSTAL